MIKLGYPLKIFLIATVISLLPVTLGVSPLDYKGSSLEAAEDDNEEERRKEEEQNYPAKRCKEFCKQ